MTSKIDEQLFPQEFAYSPAYIISRFNRFIELYGFRTVIHERDFQKSREMWAAAIFALGYEPLTSEKVWLRPVYDMPTPDIQGLMFRLSKKITNALSEVRLNLEISDWDDHYNKSLTERIFEKLHFKAYPNHYTLIIHAKKAEGTIVNLDEVYNAMQKKNPGLSAIWFVSSVKNNVADRHLLACLYPNKVRVEYDLKEAVKKNFEQEEIVKIFSRRRGISPINLGEVRLPMPIIKPK